MLVEADVDPAPFAALAPEALCTALEDELARRAPIPYVVLRVEVKPTAPCATVQFGAGKPTTHCTLVLDIDDARAVALVAWARHRRDTRVSIEMGHWWGVPLVQRAARVVALAGAPTRVELHRSPPYCERGEVPEGHPDITLVFGDGLVVAVQQEVTSQQDHAAVEAALEAAARKLAAELGVPISAG
jgi:hypothetical protein